MYTGLKELIEFSKSLKLLYVEDDEKARTATLKLLNNFFTDIVVAEDGLEAIDIISNNEFGLILSDINMPSLNGLDMLEKIRSAGNETPIIFLSAHNESKYFTQAIKLGAEYFILKPIQQEQFVDAIAKGIKTIKLKTQNKNYKQFLEKEISIQTKELEHKLHFDNITKLLNRYSFFIDIKKAEQPLLILLDINKFKMINEVYGNKIGTVVLNKFADFLLDLYQDNSYKIYRLSGDEFAVLDTHNQLSQSNVKKLIDSFFTKLNNFNIQIDNNTISLELTAGISDKLLDTYESAEIALEYAKNNKLRCKFYSSDIDKRNESSEILKRKNMIRLAIEQKRIVPVYQAIVDNSQNIVKHEILMRIQKESSDELISPYFFLEVAVKTSLYDQLSYIIIFEALNLLESSQNTLSINFTYGDIKNILLIEEIDLFFQKHPNIGSRAVFEITEDESMKNYDDVKKFIKHFKQYEVKIAIDDFGTGFSNFEHILEIEPNYIKIDGSLIKNIDNDNRSFTLVQAIVEFSHKLGIKVIAEFVHSEIIFDMLRDLKVDEYQGYYFYEPSTVVLGK